MANQEQLVLVRARVDGWNKWREDQPDKEVMPRTYAGLYQLTGLSSGPTM